MTFLPTYAGIGLAADRPDNPGFDSNALVVWYATDTGDLSYFVRETGVWCTLTNFKGVTP